MSVDAPTGHVLWSRVLECPDDPGRLAVLGDHLQAEGDVRGGLIALQLAGPSPEVRDAMLEYQFEHREVLLGPLAASESPYRAVWSGGFVRELELIARGFTEEAAATFRSLRGRRALVLLHRLRLVGTANYDAVATELLRHDWPLLEVLHFGPLALGAGRLDVPFSTLLAGFPCLRDLRVEFPGSLEGLSHPKLERLTLSLHAEQVPSLRLDGLPALRCLRLFSREIPEPGALDGVISRRLEELGLHGALLDVWLASPRLPVPERLRAYGSTPDQRRALQERVGGEHSLELSFAPRDDASKDPLLTPPEQRRPRRFVKGARFWEIYRALATLEFRFGKRGRPGTRRNTAFHSPYQASRAYQERIQAKRDEGYAEVWIPASER